jgi:hypothetical protein
MSKLIGDGAVGQDEVLQFSRRLCCETQLVKEDKDIDEDERDVDDGKALTSTVVVANRQHLPLTPWPAFAYSTVSLILAGHSC